MSTQGTDGIKVFLGLLLVAVCVIGAVYIAVSGPDVTPIAGALVGLGVVLLIGTPVSAIILRAAVALYNWTADGVDSPAAVAEPPLGKAMGIIFVVILANVFAGLFISLFVGGVALAIDPLGGGANVLAQLVALPVSMLVMASMLSNLLPTTFPRALVITLFHLIVSLVIGGVLLAILVVAFG